MKPSIAPLKRRTVHIQNGTGSFPSKVNILVVPNQRYWQAKVHRADNGSVIYTSGNYLDKRSAESEARQWVRKNSQVFVGRIASR